MKVLRWGRSAYETIDDLARERGDAEALGLQWTHVAGSDEPVPADVLVVTSGVRVDGAALDRTGARAVITTTSGYDHVDLPACRARGVALYRVPEARRDAVAEHALASLIGLMRNLGPLEAFAADGTWARDRLPELAPVGLSGSRVLIVGLGVIGTHMADVLRACGADVVGVDPAGVPDGVATGDLDALLPTVDAVTLHCALTDTSRGLFSAARLARLPAHAVLVNTARGEVLDVAAAVDAVREGRLRGLACDVFPREPWPELRVAGPNIRFTPHASGFVRDLGRRVAAEVERALAALVAGKPAPHRVI